LSGGKLSGTSVISINVEIGESLDITLWLGFRYSLKIDRSNEAVKISIVANLEIPRYVKPNNAK